MIPKEGNESAIKCTLGIKGANVPLWKYIILSWVRLVMMSSEYWWEESEIYQEEDISSRGTRLISEIVNLLDVISYSHHFIEICLLLRDSVFLSSVLYNVEVWHNINKAEVESLDTLDLMRLSRLLNDPKSTPKEALYLELGVLPINVMIKIRSVCYLHYVLKKDKAQMLWRFFTAQSFDSTEGDWVLKVQEDLRTLGIFTDTEYIKSLSKQTFKALVKHKGKEYSLQTLLATKEKHSILTYLFYFDLCLQP